VVDPVRVAVIGHTRRQSCRDAQPLLNTAQQQLNAADLTGEVDVDKPRGSGRHAR